MAKRWRLVLAACVLVAAFVLVFVWLPSTRGHLEGRVLFGQCGGGAHPMPTPASQPPGPRCTFVPVPNATVVAVHGSVARFEWDQASRTFVIHSAPPSMTARSDENGKYSLDLAPGDYMIGASELGFRVPQSHGFYSQFPPSTSWFRQIRVGGGATISFDIGIEFGAA